MSSEVSIMVRARDLTQGVFAKVKASMRGLAGQAKSIFGGLGLGGMGKMFGAAGGAFAIGNVLRQASTYAQELRDRADISPQLRKNVDAINVMNTSAQGVTTTFKNWGVTLVGNVYQALFRIKAMLGGMSWSEAKDAAEASLTDYDRQAEAAKNLAKSMREVADAKAEYNATQEGDKALLDLLLKKQNDLSARIKETAKVSQDRVDLEKEQLTLTKQIDAVKKSIAESERKAAEEAQKAYEADQARQADFEQGNFDKRQEAAGTLKEALIKPGGLKDLIKEERTRKRSEARWNRMVERATQKKAEIDAGAVGKRLSRRDRAVLAVNEANQQDLALSRKQVLELETISGILRDRLWSVK